MLMAYERSPAYKPGQKEVYKLSRSRIENFMRCPRCFWLAQRLKINQPSSPPFLINSAIDTLLKTEFDVYRKEGKQQDRKSTRLNSSHQIISYAVFCLKKKK